MSGSRWSFVLALGIPAVAMYLGVPLLSQSSTTVVGIPIVFAWVFLWLPLTTICLWLSWHFFDEPEYERVEKGSTS